MDKKYAFFLFPAFLFFHHPVLITTGRFIPSFLQPDSGRIEHILDGFTNEWPADKFEIDKETGISYAADNDASQLFVAMRINDFGEQMKLMRMGMRFFVDTKGKKKENLGIEFPLRNELKPEPGGYNAFQPGEMEKEEGKKRDMAKEMREALALNLIYMRIFGFGGEDMKNQGLMEDGKANLAYAWDSTNTMHIEYRIPLPLIDEIASLRDKTISLGWKINGMDPSSTTGTTGTIPPGGLGAGRPRRGRMPAPVSRETTGQANRADPGKMMKEQNIWTKYTIVIPAARAF